MIWTREEDSKPSQKWQVPPTTIKRFLPTPTPIPTREAGPSLHHNSLEFTMSDKCGNCDCADKSQCVKKGNTMIIETEKSYTSTEVTEVLAENGCKCGANCSCTNCTCGH
ncbi:hypothetical protein V6N12_054626 [Hibiscus sabdariffa]|uniref:Metallothionein-like protein type 3 n=1 Tax=Hibiscus sabdariffa TaxID=183260 RepID=A0ABR2D2S6_9ROSI